MFDLTSRLIIRTRYFNFFYEINTNVKKRPFLSQTFDFAQKSLPPISFLQKRSSPLCKNPLLCFQIFFKEAIVYTPFTHTLSL